MALLRFPKSARLNRAGEFARLRRDGESFHGRLMTLSVLATGGNEEARIGIITSRRVGGAVQRNRARRRLREIARKARSGLRRGLWLVIIAKPAAATAESGALSEDWTRLARRSSILTQPCP